MSVACIFHNSGNVREVEVDVLRNIDQLGDGLNTVEQNVIGNLECVEEGDLFANGLESFVGDDDERVNVILQLFDTCFRLYRKAEGLR